MTEEANQLVGRMVEATSRRGFFGRVAKLAAGVTLALGSLATRSARGGKGGKRGTKTCCIYWGGWGEQMDYFVTKCTGGKCRETYRGAMLLDSYEVADCSECGLGEWLNPEGHKTPRKITNSSQQ